MLKSRLARTTSDEELGPLGTDRSMLNWQPPSAPDSIDLVRQHPEAWDDCELAARAAEELGRWTWTGDSGSSELTAFEAPPALEMSLRDILEVSGVELPNLDELDGPQLQTKLFEIAEAMAQYGVHIAAPERLSDVELYARLEGCFHEDLPVVPW